MGAKPAVFKIHKRRYGNAASDLRALALDKEVGGLIPKWTRYEPAKCAGRVRLLQRTAGGALLLAVHLRTGTAQQKNVVRTTAGKPSSGRLDELWSKFC
jgi:hypothetical protein